MKFFIWPINSDVLTSLLLPHLSHLTDSLPSLNLLCHSKTDPRFMQDAPKAVWSNPYVSEAFFSSLKQNFVAYRYFKVSSRPDWIFKIHQLWQSGFSRLYSNSWCSCSLEPEIIKIGQSSHKMYSNKILNFQESTTILNACTKKSGKLLKAPRTPNLLFSLNCREQQCLKTSISCKNSQDYWIPEKGNSFSWRCQFQKIPSLPSGGDKHKSPFQEDVPITIKGFQKFLRQSLVSRSFLFLLRYSFLPFSFISVCLMVSTSNIPWYL